MRIAHASGIKSWDLRQANDALTQRLIALSYVVLTAIALYPIFAVAVPPLVDYPNHLARMHVLTEIGQRPLLGERYAVDWKILPNLAADVIVYALARWLPVAEAMRLFVALVLVMIVAGTLAIHYVLFGRIGLLPSAVFLFLYNHAFIYGLVNYLFGAGLFMLVFAGWMASARWPAWRRLLLFSLASIALFFAHLFAFGVYGLAVLAYELQHISAFKEQPRRAFLRDRAIVLAQFIGPLILLMASPMGDRTTYTEYGTVGNKLLALLSPTWGYGGIIDLATFVFVSVLLIGLLFSGRIKIVKRLQFPLVALLLAAVVMPRWLFGVWGVDFRLPLVLACLVVASAQVELPSVRTCLVLAALGVFLFGVRIWTISERWHGYDAQFSEFREASRAIEPGARLLVVQEYRHGSFDQPYWHVAAFAVIDRSAFLPFLFSDPTSQPVHATSAYDRIATPFGTPITLTQLRMPIDDPDMARMTGRRLPTGKRVFWANWPKDFDYVVFLHFGANANPMPKLLRQVRAGSYFDIYRIVPD